MLIHRANVRASESVLVVGAGGGVNSMAIQIAKLAGAKVYVVASDASKADRARELGADIVLDRSQVDWGREIHKLTRKRGVDLVVDNVGKVLLLIPNYPAALGTVLMAPNLVGEAALMVWLVFRGGKTSGMET